MSLTAPRSRIPCPVTVARFARLVGRPPTQAERLQCYGIARANAAIYRAWVEAGRAPAAAASSNRVAVFMPFRNNRDYVRSGALRRVLLAVIAGLGRRRARPVFWFYENDSSDGTSTLLQGTARWLEREGHEVQLLSETTAEPKGMGSERSSARCSRIAQCRNGLLGAALESLLGTPFALWLDTSVVVRPRDVRVLFEALDADPRLGMATGATVMGDGPEKDKHYYDTYAHTPLTPRSRKAEWTYTPCPSRRCPKNECQRAQRARFCTPVTPGGRRVVLVASAFGGIAAMRTEAMLRAWWSSTDNLCEHVAFCARVRKAGYKVAIVEASCGQWFR